MLLCFRYTLFQQRKTGGQNWSEKLPDFVKRLEQALFSEAKTKVSAGTLGQPGTPVRTLMVYFHASGGLWQLCNTGEQAPARG
jgi:hypothetical protein